MMSRWSTQNQNETERKGFYTNRSQNPRSSRQINLLSILNEERSKAALYNLSFFLFTEAGDTGGHYQWLALIVFNQQKWIDGQLYSEFYFPFAKVKKKKKKALLLLVVW